MNAQADLSLGWAHMPFCWLCHEVTQLQLTFIQLCFNSLCLFNNVAENKLQNKFEPHHDKTNRVACASSEDSDQPGHSSGLISLHCAHKESLGPKLSTERTAKTLSRLGECPGFRVLAGRTWHFVDFVMMRLI